MSTPLDNTSDAKDNKAASVSQSPQPCLKAPGIQRAPFQIDYEPQLLEDAVFLAVNQSEHCEPFHKERDKIYEIKDPDQRENEFRQLHRRWFLRLAMHRPIEEALDERQIIADSTARCIVAAAKTRKDEGAELFVEPIHEAGDKAQHRIIGLQIRPGTFLDPDSLLALARHEFLHIVFMLDPTFGYEPTLAYPDDHPTHIPLLKRRYRALWDALIDGQLVRENLAPPALRDQRLHDFELTFPALGSQIEEAFSRFFDGECRSHDILVAYAHAPETMLSNPEPGSKRAAHCPLCKFPTFAFLASPQDLPLEALDKISRDFPAWRPDQGLCEQCAGLYLGQSLSATKAQEASPCP